MKISGCLATKACSANCGTGTIIPVEGYDDIRAAMDGSSQYMTVSKIREIDVYYQGFVASDDSGREVRIHRCPGSLQFLLLGQAGYAEGCESIPHELLHSTKEHTNIDSLAVIVCPANRQDTRHWRQATPSNRPCAIAGRVPDRKPSSCREPDIILEIF